MKVYNGSKTSDEIYALIKAHCRRREDGLYAVWDAGWSDEMVATRLGVSKPAVAVRRVELVGNLSSRDANIAQPSAPVGVFPVDDVVAQVVAALKPLFAELERRVASVEEMVLKQDGLLEAHSQSIEQDAISIQGLLKITQARDDRLEQHRSEQSDVNASLSKRVTAVKDFTHQVNNSLLVKIERLERIVKQPVRATITKGPRGTLVRFTTRDGSRIEGGDGDPDAGYVEVSKATHQMALDLESARGPKADASLNEAQAAPTTALGEKLIKAMRSA